MIKESWELSGFINVVLFAVCLPIMASQNESVVNSSESVSALSPSS